MSLDKNAQLQLEGVRIKPEDLSMFEDLRELGDLSDLRVDLAVSPEDEEELSLMELGGELSGDIIIELDDDKTIKKEFNFDLPKIPGAEFQDLEEESEISVQEEEVNDLRVESDPWKWELKTFMPWLQEKLDVNSPAFPRHSGKDIFGLERIISYMKKILQEISKASRMDYDNILDGAAIENVRDQILSRIEGCEERIEQIEAYKRPKKKNQGPYRTKGASHDTDSLVKEAQKAAGFQINVPLFISCLARICINSYVSAGHDIERTFKKLSEKCELTKREQMELLQLLADMNYPVRRDRGFFVDEEIDTTSSDNFDWAAQYPA